MSDSQSRLAALGRAASDALENDLLPFWHRMEDRAHGGHFAAMSHAGVIDRKGPKSTVFVARILWTMSEAGRSLGSASSIEQARHAARFLLDRLRDRESGGFFWSVTHDGRPHETDKHLYAHAFAIYGLSAFAAATGSAEAHDAAAETFALVEDRARTARSGYREAFDRMWLATDNRRLSAGRAGASRTMNAHLHLMEAYTALAALTGAENHRAALADCLDLILRRFLAPGATHAYAMLDDGLTPLDGPISMGHDIETAWLLDAAADVIGDAALSARARSASDALTLNASEFGYCGARGFLAERAMDGTVDPWRVWWVQAEAVVGFVNAYQRTGDEAMLARAEILWDYIERVMRDRRLGEWHWRVDAKGRPDPKKPKVEPWKESYHQARACLELMRRSGRIR